MKRLIYSALFLSMTFALTAGCSDKATTTRTEKINTPNGSTEVEQKETVKKSGENPPNP